MNRVVVVVDTPEPAKTELQTRWDMESVLARMEDEANARDAVESQ